MPVRVSRATAVIVHQVPPSAVDHFLKLQEGLTQAVESFPGYQATEVYPPNDPTGVEWVVVIHFSDAAALKAWLDAPVRAEWVEKARKEVGTFGQVTLTSGFGSWFTKPGTDLSPGWKMVLIVLLGLYPTVILLSLTVGVVVGPLGIAVAMLIGNAMSVTLLQYVIMPVLTSVFGPWLHANTPEQRIKSIAGLGVILLLLTTLTLIFRQITG